MVPPDAEVEGEPEVVRRAVCCVLVLAAAGGLAGCADETTPPPNRTVAATQFARRSEVPEKHVGDTVVLAGLLATTEAAMAAAGPARFTLTGAGLAGEGVIDTARGATRMSVTQDGQTLQFLLVGDSIYAGGQDVAARLGPGQAWVELTESSDDDAGGTLGPLASMVGGMTDVLRALRGIDAQAEVTAVRDGLTTFTTTLGPAHAARLRANLLGSMAEAVPQPAGALTATITQVQDPRGLPTTVVTEQFEGGVSNGPLTLTYLDWGKALPVLPPAASEVGSFGTRAP